MAEQLERIKTSIQKEFAQRLEEHKNVIEARVNGNLKVERSRLAAEFNKKMAQFKTDYDKDKAFLSQQFHDLEVNFNQLEVALQANKEIEAHRQAKIDAQYETVENALLTRDMTSGTIGALFKESNPDLKRLEVALGLNKETLREVGGGIDKNQTEIAALRGGCIERKESQLQIQGDVTRMTQLTDSQ